MASTTANGETLALQVRDLAVDYRVRARATRVVHGVGFDVPAGRTLGLVGESGSGKSTIAAAIVGLVRPAAGSVTLGGVDLAQLRGRTLRDRRRQVQLVPQDPYGSLDPRMVVGDSLAEALGAATRRRSRALRSRVGELLEAVALQADAAEKLPREFSGGQRQRIAIARALAAEPQLLIADEITSALDCSVQAGILALLAELRAARSLTILFITHDLGVVSSVSDEIAVLYQGRIVEHGTCGEVLQAPRHPYTRLLLDSVPRLGRPAELPADEAAAVEDADNVAASGCPFHPRCPSGPRTNPGREACRTDEPVLLPWGDVRCACHFPFGSQRRND